MKYRFRATERFWASFYQLPARKKEAVRHAWQVFKENPFDARLGTHKIQRLSAHYGRTIYAVVIEGDLRVTFYVEGDLVTTLTVGTHAIYKE